MCGIVGYIGSKNATPILLNGLSSLEYRGYDSAGIAVLEKENICVLKDKGRVDNLKNIEKIQELTGNIGIAHTRWATHGIPSKENSHPHLDNSGSFAVVHNGIIENYNELKAFLQSKGYYFISQTDTEVIPNLIHYYYTNNNTDEDRFLNAIKSACDDLNGSYAIQVISKLYPDRIVVVRKDSPLVVGTSNGENFIASDIPAILNHTRKFYFLEDNEFAVIFKDKIIFYDKNLTRTNNDIKTIEWDNTAADKNGFKDYMLKEIYEQPTAIRNTINSRIEFDEPCVFDDLNISNEYLKSIKNIYIVACGTAMYAGLVGKDFMESLCKIPVNVEVASEFRYRNPIIDEKTLCIYISQSGETADTIAALKLAKNKGAKTLAISNVIGSSITREADYTIYTNAGPEIAVASTKAYTSQVIMLATLSIHFAEILNSCDIERINKLKGEILNLPLKIESVLEDTTQIQDFAHKMANDKDAFFIGRGVDYHVALEGSLKLKEISYIHSEAYPAGELKHGPIALIEDGITVIGIMNNPELVEKTVSNLQEVISRGAKTLIISNQKLENVNFDCIINIPLTDPLLSPILSVIPLQLLAYYIAQEKGLDIDKPRNLAKSVTVE